MPLRAPVSTDDNAPVINGHSDPEASLSPICTALAARVTGFLETEQATPLLKQVQEQTRVALGVIDEALERYRCVNCQGQERRDGGQARSGGLRSLMARKLICDLQSRRNLPLV